MPVWMVWGRFMQQGSKEEPARVLSGKVENGSAPRTFPNDLEE